MVVVRACNVAASMQNHGRQKSLDRKRSWRPDQGVRNLPQYTTAFFLLLHNAAQKGQRLLTAQRLSRPQQIFAHAMLVLIRLRFLRTKPRMSTILCVPQIRDCAMCGREPALLSWAGGLAIRNTGSNIRRDVWRLRMSFCTAVCLLWR